MRHVRHTEGLAHLIAAELVRKARALGEATVLSWHWYTSGDTKDDLLSLHGKDVVSVDLNDAPPGIPVDQQVDNTRELPASTGVIDVKTFLASLEKIGFDGPIRAEPFNERVRQMAPEEALGATMASLKKAFGG